MFVFDENKFQPREGIDYFAHVLKQFTLALVNEELQTNYLQREFTELMDEREGPPLQRHYMQFKRDKLFSTVRSLFNSLKKRELRLPFIVQVNNKVHVAANPLEHAHFTELADTPIFLN